MMNLEARKMMQEELSIKQQQLEISRFELELTKMDASMVIIKFLSGIFIVLGMAVSFLELDVSDGALWSLIVLGLVCCVALIIQLYQVHKVWTSYKIRMGYLKSN